MFKHLRKLYEICRMNGCCCCWSHQLIVVFVKFVLRREDNYYQNCTKCSLYTLSILTLAWLKDGEFESGELSA